MSKFFPTLDSDATIYIAGNSNQVDPAAFALANKVLSSLYLHLEQIQGLDHSTWNISTLSFPYQVSGELWFIEFRSEYDGDLKYSFSKTYLEDLRDKVEQITYNVLPEAHIPALVEWAIEELLKVKVNDADFEVLLKRIDSESLQGREILVDVKNLFIKHSEVIPAWPYSRIIALINKCEAIAK